MGAKERREREREQRKEHILDTARKLLLEKGLNATSINQIAKHSELSVGAIYFYFRDKEDLFASLQLEGLDLLSRSIRKSVRPDCSPEDKIRSIAKAYLRFSEEHKNYYDIINYFLTSPGTIFSPTLKLKIDEHGNASISTLTAAIQEGIDAGTFKPLDSRRQAIILWSAFNGIIHLKKTGKDHLVKNEYKSIYLEAVERFLDSLRK